MRGFNRLVVAQTFIHHFLLIIGLLHIVLVKILRLGCILSGQVATGALRNFFQLWHEVVKADHRLSLDFRYGGLLIVFVAIDRSFHFVEFFHQLRFFSAHLPLAALGVVLLFGRAHLKRGLSLVHFLSLF